MHYALHFDGDDVTDLSVEVRASVLLVADTFIQATLSAKGLNVFYIFSWLRTTMCLREQTSFTSS
jgi:hypothetical protein